MHIRAKPLMTSIESTRFIGLYPFSDKDLTGAET
jgi:hypothetical protein